MTRTTKIRRLSIVFLALTGTVHAELGGNAESIESDQNQAKATQQVTDTPRYTLHHLQTAAGIQVREYVGADGTVFAVAWEGPQLPDLQKLLGTYFGRYTDAARQRDGRGALLITQSDLVVQSGGRMRSFSGRAYLPGRMPEGVTPESIQ